MPTYVDHDSGTATAATALNLTGLTLTGSNRVLYGFIAAHAGTSFTATWNGASMGAPIYDDAPAPAYIPVKVWRMVAPAAVSATLAFAWTGSAGAVAGAIAFADAHQTTPNDAIDVATGEDVDTVANAVTSESGDLVFDVALVSEAASGTTANTERIDVQNAAENLLLLCSTAPGAASVAMDWTIGFGAFVSLGFNVNAAAAGGDLAPTIAAEAARLSDAASATREEPGTLSVATIGEPTIGVTEF